MMDDVIFQLVEDAKNEDWKAVDRQIPKVAGKREYAKWAYNEALTSRNGHVRDLGASILEKATLSHKDFALMRDRLFFRMQNDSNQYARFRSAFALAAHGPGQYKENVIRVLQRAEKWDVVSKAAKRYLSELHVN